MRKALLALPFLGAMTMPLVISSAGQAAPQRPLTVAQVEVLATSQTVLSHVQRRKIAFVPSDALLRAHPSLLPLASSLRANVGVVLVFPQGIETLTWQAANSLKAKLNNALRGSTLAVAKAECPGACSIELTDNAAEAAVIAKFAPSAGGGTLLSGPDKLTIRLVAEASSGVQEASILLYVGHGSSAATTALEASALAMAAKWLTDSINGRALQCGIASGSTPAVESLPANLRYSFDRVEGGFFVSPASGGPQLGMGFGKQTKDQLPANNSFDDDARVPVRIEVGGTCDGTARTVSAAALDGIDDAMTITTWTPDFKNGFAIVGTIRWFGENHGAEDSSYSAIAARNLGGVKTSWGLGLDHGMPQLSVVLDHGGTQRVLRLRGDEKLLTDRWYQVAASWRPAEGLNLWLDGKPVSARCYLDDALVKSCTTAGTLHEPTVSLAVLVGGHHGSETEEVHRSRFSFNGLIQGITLGWF